MLSLLDDLAAGSQPALEDVLAIKVGAKEAKQRDRQSASCSSDQWSFFYGRASHTRGPMTPMLAGLPLVLRLHSSD